MDGFREKTEELKKLVERLETARKLLKIYSKLQEIYDELPGWVREIVMEPFKELEEILEEEIEELRNL